MKNFGIKKGVLRTNIKIKPKCLYAPEKASIGVILQMKCSFFLDFVLEGIFDKHFH